MDKNLILGILYVYIFSPQILYAVRNFGHNKSRFSRATWRTRKAGIVCNRGRRFLVHINTGAACEQGLESTGHGL
ncbi:MAG: hypothetical protein ACI4TQ_00260, partial [Alloprevotella sp.]